LIAAGDAGGQAGLLKDASATLDDRFRIEEQKSTVATATAAADPKAAGGDEAKRAFDAMMGMKKIDIAAIKAARRG
jgi:hypothetical protein